MSNSKSFRETFNRKMQAAAEKNAELKALAEKNARLKKLMEDRIALERQIEELNKEDEEDPFPTKDASSSVPKRKAPGRPPKAKRTSSICSKKSNAVVENVVDNDTMNVATHSESGSKEFDDQQSALFEPEKSPLNIDDVTMDSVHSESGNQSSDLVQLSLLETGQRTGVTFSLDKESVEPVESNSMRDETVASLNTIDSVPSTSTSCESRLVGLTNESLSNQLEDGNKKASSKDEQRKRQKCLDVIKKQLGDDKKIIAECYNLYSVSSTPTQSLPLFPRGQITLYKEVRDANGNLIHQQTPGYQFPRFNDCPELHTYNLLYNNAKQHGNASSKARWGEIVNHLYTSLHVYCGDYPQLTTLAGLTAHLVNLNETCGLHDGISSLGNAALFNDLNAKFISARKGKPKSKSK